MKIQCDVCEKAPATVICCADEAALCAKCDVEVHAANKLASKHQRLLLESLSNKLPRCDICQDKAAFIFCVEDRALFCQDCDESIHSANSLSANHQRFLATGIRVALSSPCTKDAETSSVEPPNHSPQLVSTKVPTPHASLISSPWGVDDLLQLSDFESSDKKESLEFGELEWIADMGLFGEQFPQEALADKELELNVSICIEEELPDDPEILGIAELLRINVPMAMKLAFDGLKDSEYKTRDDGISDVGGFRSVELSVMLCNDEFIRKLNKEWRDEDHATDVLSMSQHVPELRLPILMLGDVVISVETAARQAEERGHTILDEIRILMIHGLLHLLGFDHEISEEAEVEMEKEEELLLKSLGWTGKGLIQSASNAEINAISHEEKQDDRKREGSLRYYKPKFKYIFCDMDGTLLNSNTQISSTTAKALKEVSSRGVKIVIATGKTRSAVINIFKMVDLAGKDGIVSEFSTGVFCQGLLVYGKQGREIFKGNLDPNVCREACLYSWENRIPLIAYSEDRCFTLFDHPLVDSLHTVYHEPKGEIMPSVEHLLAAGDIQKVIFMDTAEGVATTLRPYWSGAIRDRAAVVQAQPDMLEIVPPGTSKGSGVKLLLDHMGITPKEIMAIGDGENDIEMLELASLGVALSNGSEKTKAVANLIGASNDEDGAADAIYRYAF